MKKSLFVIMLGAVALSAAPASADQHRHASHGRAVVVAPARGVYVAPRYAYVAPRYYRPYYAFRPRFSIGFGISVGYPVAYPAYAPYYYPAPYGYPYYAPPAYAYPSQPYPPQPYQSQPYPSQSYPSQPYPQQQGYPSQSYPSQSYPQGGSYPSQPYPSNGGNSVQMQPRTASPGNAGGVSFEISPSDAAVYVDGRYAGTVDQFGPQTEPLRLVPGRHHIELRANGMQPMAFDATVVAGQVIPYRGTLQ